MNSIGERLTYARKFRGFTQAQLSEESYVTRGVIANIETGRFTAQTVALVALSNALNINKEWLIDGVGPMEPDNQRAQILEELYRVCATLTEPQQRFLLETIRAMNTHLIPEQEPAKENGNRPFEEIVRDAESRKGQPNPTRRITEKEI